MKSCLKVLALSALLGLAAPAAWADSLYVSDFFTIYKYNTTTGTRTVFSNSGGTTISGMEFNSSGNMFASSRDDNAVFEYSPSGVRSTFANVTFPAYGLAIDGSNNVFINKGFGGIEEYSPSGSPSVFAPGGGRSMAFDQTGELFDSDGNGSIFKYDPNGTKTTFATNAGTQAIITTDPSGDVFAANWGGQIYKYDPSGARSLFASFNSSLILPTSLAYDNSTGILYMSEVANGTSECCFQTILEYSPTGVQSTFATGLYDPFAMTIAENDLPSVPGNNPNGGPVSTPEPGTLLLLTSGAGMLFARYRKRTV